MKLPIFTFHDQVQFPTFRRLLRCLTLVALLFCAALLLPAVRAFLVEDLGRALIGRPVGAEGFYQARLAWWGLGGICFFAMLFFSQTQVFLKLRLTPSKKNALCFTVQAGLFSLFAGISVLFIKAFDALDVDEASTLAFSKHTFSEISELCGGDTWPPLYYFYTRILVILFGATEETLRFGSLALLLSALAICACFLNREFTKKSAILFLLLANCSFILLRFGIVIRGYTLAFLFVSLTTIALWFIAKNEQPRPHWYFLLLLSILGAAYTNYYAATFVAILCAISFLRIVCQKTALCSVDKFAPEGLSTSLSRSNTKRKAFLLILVGGLAVLFYLPWLSIVIHTFSAVSSDYIISPDQPFFERIHPLFAISQTGIPVLDPVRNCLYLPLFLYFSAVCIFLFSAKKNCVMPISVDSKRQTDYLASLLLCIFIFYASMTLFSYLARPLLFARYMLPAYVWFFVFVSVIFGRFHRAFIFIACALFSFCVAETIPNVLDEVKSETKTFKNFWDVLVNDMQKADSFFVVDDKENQLFYERFTFSQRFPDNKNVFVKKAVWYLDGVGDDAHYRRLYGGNLVPFSQIELTDSVAWIAVAQKSRHHLLFLTHLKGDAELRGEIDRWRNGSAPTLLYRVSPATKLRPWLEAETQILQESR